MLEYSPGGWVETDPTWVIPDEWTGNDGVRRVTGYVLDSNYQTFWRGESDQDTWQLEFDLQTPMTLSRIRIWLQKETDGDKPPATPTLQSRSGRNWVEVPHKNVSRPPSDPKNLEEVDLIMRSLPTGQLWRLQFSRPREIVEIKFFQACSGVEKTVCTDGDCDVHEVICDGIVDCDDGSDENNCDAKTCPNGSTIREAQVCDGIDDCGDSADEQNCSASTCDNGALFHPVTRCDGKDDCGDNSDEQNCVCYYLRDRGTSYRGIANRNNSCQFWTSQYPHPHNHTPQAYPSAGLERNYCRNPDGKDRPWCYTNNPFIRWMYCEDVFACDAPPTRCFYVIDKGRSYAGKINRVGDRLCQRWDSQSPHSHPHTPQAHPDAGLEENFCRNPDNKERPWCYTTDEGWRWDYCEVMECADPFAIDCKGHYTCDGPNDEFCFCDNDCAVFGDCCEDVELSLTNLFNFNAHGSDENSPNQCPSNTLFDPFAETCRISSSTHRSPSSSNRTNPLQNCSEPALKFNSDEFKVLPNGSVHLMSSNVSCPAEQVAILNATALICGECILQYFSNHTRIADSWDPGQAWLTLGLVIASAVAVFAYMVYTVRSGHWQKLPEKLKAQMMVNVVIAESLFVSRVWVPLGPGCAALAVILHYSLLTAFTSMNALAMDIFLTFGDSLERPKLHQYLTYTWLTPVPIVVVTVIIEFGSSVRVGYGENCWIGNPVASLLAFGVPVLCALVANAVLVALALLAIRKTFKIADAANSRSNSTKAWVYLRISFLMGFTWLLGFIYPFVNSNVLEYIFIVLNASQGLLLTLIVTLTGEVVEKGMSAIRACFGLAEPEQNNGATTTTSNRRTRGITAQLTEGETNFAEEVPMTTLTDVDKRAHRQQTKVLQGNEQTSLVIHLANDTGGTEATAGGTGSAEEIPMTTFAVVEVEENKEHLRREEPRQNSGQTATDSELQATARETEATTSDTGSAGEIFMRTFAVVDVEESKERLRLEEPRQNSGQTATDSKQQTTEGETEPTAGGTDSAEEIPITNFAVVDVEENKKRLRLGEPRQNSGQSATDSKQQATKGETKGTPGYTSSAEEISMTTSAVVDVEEKMSGLHLEVPCEDRERTASSHQVITEETDSKAGQTGSAEEIAMTTFAAVDVEEKMSGLHLGESRDDCERTASSQQAITGDTVVTADGKKPAIEIPMAAFPGVDKN
uniref:G-protein coupled receptors family 2 profile 2 domain-containing protein n=1 Tax=Branchiostoma floridae TaxID=7739 RepID=C3ZFJ6_BRAFL|eukprot:XP_002592739.1 hypothetical protein BRAFLDRAFT_67179 [Branchiostoma floridae]